MVEFNREEGEKIDYGDSYNQGQNYWKVFTIVLIIGFAILLAFLFLYSFNNNKKTTNEKIKIANESFSLGMQQGIILGKSQCPICTSTTTCPICESPNQTVLNIAQEQTIKGNMILWNGTNVVSLPIKALCEQLQNNTIPA